MNSTLMQSATGLSCYVAAEHSAFTAPNAAAQGTGLPIAGTSLASVAAAAAAVVVDVRSTDLPGLPPRGAPV